MSGIDKIVKQAGATKKTPSQEAKESKERQDEIVKELVKEPPAPEKRKPGRPRSNSTDKPPVTPKSPRLPDIPLDSAPKTGNQGPAPQLDPAQRIANEMLVETLSALCAMFPHIVKNSLEGYNPHLHSPAQNQSIIDNIIKAARNKATLATMPFASEKVLQAGEDMAMYYAVTNPNSKVAPVIMDLQGITGAVLQDPILGTEIKLLQCQLLSALPDNPIFRIGFGLFTTISSVISHNRKQRQFAMNAGSAIDPNAYQDF